MPTLDDGRDDDADLLADRVDVEPPIFKGCSSSELGALLLAAIALWAPLSLLLAALAGRLPFALAILAVGVIGSVYLGALALQRVKRDRPDHYYLHALQRLAHRHGLRRARFLWRSGWWDIDRC